MKVSDLLTEQTFDVNAAKKTSFDAKAGRLSGSVKDWLDAMGLKPADIAEAIKQIKASDVFKKVEDAGFEYEGTARTEKNGLLRFSRPIGGFYEVAANGQIRWTDGGSSRTPLKSEKPLLKHGDPVKSLINIYTAALKKILAKKVKD